MRNKSHSSHHLGLAPTSRPPRIHTKEDCLTFFCATGVPPAGALWGVYRWVADLGKTRYNFDIEPNGHNLNLLDAYD